MSHILPRRATAGPSAAPLPIQIGGIAATTIGLSLSEVLFDSAVVFVMGTRIEFSVVVGRAEAAVEVGCHATVTSSTRVGNGRHRTAARIDHFEVVRETN